MTAMFAACDDVGNMIYINLDHVTHVCANEKEPVEVHLTGGRKLALNDEHAASLVECIQTHLRRRPFVVEEVHAHFDGGSFVLLMSDGEGTPLSIELDELHLSDILGDVMDHIVVDGHVVAHVGPDITHHRVHLTSGTAAPSNGDA